MDSRLIIIYLFFYKLKNSILIFNSKLKKINDGQNARTKVNEIKDEIKMN
jgi:hypothetical protein